MTSETFDSELRELIQQDNSLIEFSDGRVWRVKNREAVWDQLGSRLYDRNLDAAKDLAVKVLTERDPKFDLDPDERFYADSRGRKLGYSEVLREGMAETLALLGNRNQALVNCSPGKAQNIAILAIREILAHADWRLWGSLNRLLPTLAEAAPKEFLRSVESSLADPACPFDELFSQEGDGITSGDNYLTGLLWALEALAWDEELLARICIVLAELAEHDPGGRWANRPANSISAILLPWYPQTYAPIERRFAAVRAVVIDSPRIGWKVLLELLPHGMSTTSGTHKPRWRNPVPEDWKPKVTRGEHWDQVQQYAQMAVDLAGEDFERLTELTDRLDDLPKPSFDALLDLLKSKSAAGLDSAQKSRLWGCLTKFTNKHRRFSDAKWALPTELLDSVDEAAELFRPEDPRLLYKPLFSNNDFDLYEGHESYEEEQEKLTAKRKHAVRAILGAGGLDAITEFSTDVESPHALGRAAAELESAELDRSVLPELLTSDEMEISAFASSYAFVRFLKSGEKWLDDLNRAGWSRIQCGALLKSLPFDQPTWDRVDPWLAESANDYWLEVSVNPYHANSKLELAIEKLLDVDRPLAAIECLYCQLHRSKSFDAKQAIRALRNALSTTESVGGMAQHYITELIKAVQEDETVSEEDLAGIEWGYLRLLQRDDDVEPALLMSRLATDPEFFCEVIQLIYKSRNEKTESTAVLEEKDESRVRLAENAWHLLFEWNRPPGAGPDGDFDEKEFSVWLERVEEISRETGHFEVSMVTVGQVLYFTPKATDGFWINRAVAERLDSRGAHDLRSGFTTQIFNTRGAHWVDPTGSPERELAEKWRVRAQETEQQGFARFADSLRDVATSYERDAERIVREHSEQ